MGLAAASAHEPPRAGGEMWDGEGHTSPLLFADKPEVSLPLTLRLPRRPCTGDQTYLLMFLSEKWAFTAVRCSDEEVSFGQLAGQTPRDRLVW